MYKAWNDKTYREILNATDLVLPDGLGLKLATKILGGRMKENCNGTDFSPLFMAEAAQRGLSVFFLGGKEGVAEKAAEKISKQIPGIKITGTQNGYFDNDDKIIKKINAASADIVFVGMGVPIQEKWITKNREKLNSTLCLGVGALFDYLSGRIKRAPKIFQKMHIEWLWRIMMEPKRLWKRYLVDDVKFLWLVLKHKNSPTQICS
ncbi:WecB/TagA/CpsF family glycosyltransferase [Candidatus Omnitrophota bacterium]